MKIKDMIANANAALEFIKKLNFEISYLIKEVEGRLKEEPEEFIIGKGSGYAVSGPRSCGLNSPNDWIMNKMSVFFVPEEYSSLQSGYTKTPFINSLKAIFLLIVLHDKTIEMPMLYMGTMYDISIKNDKYCKKLEHLLQTNHLWNLSKLFEYEVGDVHTHDNDYEYYHLKYSVGRSLFDIENSELIRELLLEPSLKDFRSIQ